MQIEIEKPKKRNPYLMIAVFLGVLVMALAIFVCARWFLENSPKPASGAPPDDIALTTLPNGNRLVNDKTGGYSFILPANWYLEKKEGSGIAVYPDYAPQSGGAPKCKIEVSVFKNIAAANINNWVTIRLHADPTIAVSETLRAALSVPGAKSAFEWKGTMDGITTTLAYVSAEGNIYEIAPSVLDIQKADGNTACDSGFQLFLNGISFWNNE